MSKYKKSILALVLLVTVGGAGCTDPSERWRTAPMTSEKKGDLAEVKGALVFYVMMHPGCFGGRADAERLRAQSWTRLYHGKAWYTYNLGEFVLDSGKLWARYQASVDEGGWSETVVYEVQLIKTPEGKYHVFRIIPTAQEDAPPEAPR